MRRLVLVLVPLVAVGTGVGVWWYATQPPAPESVSPVPTFPAGGEPARSPGTDSPYPYGRVLVIAIGINRYPNLTGEETTLRFAEADASGFADLARSHFGYEAQTLLGEQASKRAVELAVKKAAEELGPEDALIVFFAGHGQVIELPGAGEAGFLVPQDAALDMKVTARHAAWAASAINVHDLFTRASESRARHVLFILDACKSGISVGRGALGERADLRTFLFDRSRAVLTATRRDQVAREDHDRGHGQFTAALLDRLRLTEPASVLDVYQHVSRTVANRTNGTMMPQFGQIEGDGMMVFIPRAIPRAEIERDLRDVPHGPLAGVQGRAAEARKQLTTLDEVFEAFRALDYRPAPDAEDQAKLWEARFARFLRNAGLGDPRAMAAASLCYAKGLGTKADATRAYDWARQTDHLSHSAGLGRWVLGLCQENGIGVAGKNPAAAEKLFRESAAAGNPGGKLSLARLLARKSGVDRAEIRRLFLEAEQSGLPEAGLDWADWLLSEEPPNRKTAVAEAQAKYEAAASRGDPRGELGLFFILADGRPGFPPRDEKKAEAHLRKAAAAGLPPALYYLGRAYEPDASEHALLEFPKEKNNAVAREYYDRAARLNYPPALVRSAQLLMDGRGGPTDEKLGLERLDTAVALDYPRAYVLKGLLYSKGHVLPKDEEKALQWYKNAAVKGDPRGCTLYGWLLWMGPADRTGKRPGDGFRFHERTAEGAHWLMQALILDEDKWDYFAQKTAAEFLNYLRDAYNNDPQGTRGDENPLAPTPAEVLAEWKKRHSDTFKQFCERYKITLDSKKPPSQ